MIPDDVCNALIFRSASPPRQIHPELFGMCLHLRLMIWVMNEICCDFGYRKCDEYGTGELAVWYAQYFCESDMPWWKSVEFGRGNSARRTERVNNHEIRRRKTTFI